MGGISLRPRDRPLEESIRVEVEDFECISYAVS